jgi:hypothetical protein
MKATFLKGIVLGSVVSLAMLSATAAFAGSGVGGVFNLGKYNGVNGPTALAGKSAGPQLHVFNTSGATGATGVSISVHGGKPPLVVNSSTKVSHLNADQLDGLEASQLQRRVTGQCANRTAISAVNADGSVSCASTAVYPIYHSFGSITGPSTTDAFGTSGLILNLSCFNTSIVGLGFSNTGPNAGTVNETLTTGGSSTVTESPISAGGAVGFSIAGSRLAGQFIWTTTTGKVPFITRYVVTLNIHQANSATGCVFTGTAELATMSVGKI